MSKFFINRPIFAWVVAIVVMLAGVLAIKGLPINQYPNVAPPAISISVTYPGASAQAVQDTVVQVIEQQLNGLDGLRYITSASESDGSMQIVVTFEQGTAGSAAARHPRGQVPDELHAGGGPGVGRRLHEFGRPGGLHCHQPAGSHLAYLGRG